MQEKKVQIIVRGGTNHIYGNVGQVHHHNGGPSEPRPVQAVHSPECAAAGSTAAPSGGAEGDFFRNYFTDEEALAGFVSKVRHCSNSQQLAHFMVDEVMVHTTLTYDCLVQASCIEHLIPLLTFTKGSSKPNLQAQLRKVYEQKMLKQKK